jgi:hypothetical protein
VNTSFALDICFADIGSYEMARSLLARGLEVNMVCGSYSRGETGMSQPFVGGRRRGTMEGIVIVEFNSAFFNADGFVKRGLTFLKFALCSIGIAFTEMYEVLFATTTLLTAGISCILRAGRYD